MKKLIFLLIIPFLLSGCFDYNELDDLAIITGVGIDYKEEEYEVTFEIISTKKEGETSGSTSAYTRSSSAKTISEAFAKNGNIMDKVAYYNHIEIVIIDEEIAKNHLKEVSEFLIRSSRFRNEFYMAIANNTTAKELLNTTSKEKPLASTYMANLLEHNNDSNNAGYYTPFTETLNSIINKGEDAIISIFTLDEKKIKLDGMGIFKDFELKEKINNEEASILNLLNNFNAENIYLKKPCNNSNKNIVISIYDSKISFEPNNDFITVKAKLSGRIHEDSCSDSLRKEDTYKELEKEFSKILEEKMENIINILKINQSNALKIGTYEHIKYRNNDYFAWINKPFKYEIDLKINKKGLIFEVT